MLLDNIIVDGSRDAERCNATHSIAEIIEIMRSDMYAEGATDVRTFEEDFLWYCSLSFEQRMEVNRDMHAIMQETIRREKEAEALQMMDCALCCKPAVKADMIELLCPACDEELAAQANMYDDGSGRCSCEGHGSCDHCRWNGSYPGEGGPDDWDYPEGMCHCCHERVGVENLVNNGCVECNHKLHEEALAVKLMGVASGVQAEYWPVDELDDLPF